MSMRFCKGYFTYSNFKDVFIEVLSVPYRCNEYTKIKILWWNKNKHGKPFIIFPSAETIKIKKDEYKNWSRINLNDLTFYRNEVTL